MEINAAEVSPMTGFVLDPTPIEIEIAQMQSVRKEYDLQNTYVEDFDGWWDEYRQKIEKAGLQKCVDEVNAQVQAWKIANGK